MRFFLGDDSGQLKSVTCIKTSEKDWKLTTNILDDGGQQGKSRTIQRLAVKDDSVALSRRDGSAALYSVEQSAESAKLVQQWQETWFKKQHQYIGLNLTERGVMSCTSNGHLRLTHTSIDAESDVGITSQVTSIPTRLSDWILSEDATSFAYGGNEVEVSLWDTSRAFDPSRRLLPDSAMGTKRRKGQISGLLDGEMWRAKNVSNDFLNLRQPVHNTSLSFLSPISGGSGFSHHILAGTILGSVRRYDTRVAQQPVADWKGIAKVGGIRKVQRGNFEHEAFIADNGSHLFVLDVRTGRVLYAYSGIAGAISSLAPTTSSLSPPLLASTSLDRYFRLHSTYQPSTGVGAPLAQKGEMLAKVWLKSAAACVAWDGRIADGSVGHEKVDGEDGEDGDIWAKMQDVCEEEEPSVGSKSEDEAPVRKKRKKIMY